MKAIKYLITPLLGLALLLQTGCALLLVGGGAAAGVGGYAYVKGELKAVERTSLDKAWEASVAAMKELQFSIASQSKDYLTGHLTARTAQDKKIAIDIKALPNGSTEIRIRVGTFGDEALSLVIVDTIKKHL